MGLQDKISRNQAKSYRKIRDYHIHINGTETFVIRLKVSRNMYGDSTGFQIVSHDTLSVSLDIPNELPLTRLRKDVTQPAPQTENIYLHDIIPIEGWAKTTDNVEREDILIVRIYDEKDGEVTEQKPYLLVLRVSEILGMIGNRRIVNQKFNCSPYNVALPVSVQELVDSYIEGEDDYYYNES